MKKNYKKYLEEIKKQTTTSFKQLDEFKNEFIGKDGVITKLMKEMRLVPNEEKKNYGKEVNELKSEFLDIYSEKEKEISKLYLEKQLQKEKIDLTIPYIKSQSGSSHPIKNTVRVAEDIFTSLGYYIANGQEIEEDRFNFEYLNIPKDHPARDMQDTFYVNNNLLLRTHTSGMQIREMMKNQKPIKLISHGKVYRRDEDDATHSHQFSQIEGLWIGKNVTLSDLKTHLKIFLGKYFEKEVEIFLRPSYFPFTEPSIEVDVTCVNCDGVGCSICKQTGLIEILGAGMVNSKLFENCGLDPKEYQGFAFGIGVERITMIKHKISDIRDFYNNDLKLIKQF
jgi:phenylalanyl-tRNA synthetase alpha chain